MIELDVDTSAAADALPVATMTLNRSSNKNALDRAAWRQVADACAALGEQADEVRLVVLKSAVDGVFSAGADMAEFDEIAREPALAEDNHRVMTGATAALAALPMPTLAVIDGPCMGGGLALALACDIRAASGRSRFAVPPARLGLVYPLDDLMRLRTAVGETLAKDMLLTARRLDAEEALAAGLVTRLFDGATFAADVADLIGGIAALSPFSLRSLKAQFCVGADPSAADRYRFRRLFVEAFAGTDHREGLAAVRDKRKPRFGY